jgi:hypothetical protein
LTATFEAVDRSNQLNYHRPVAENAALRASLTAVGRKAAYVEQILDFFVNVV